MTKSPESKLWARDGGWLPLVGLLVLQWWVAHAVAFFAHEYVHSFTAWLMGWKTNPLALNYAHPSLKVLLIQMGIDQNVNEEPIFASGRGVQAAMISGAGMVLGNGLITLPLSVWLCSRARQASARGWAMFAYWLCVASVGNLIDYVPLRLFTDGTDLYQDMFAVELGLGWTPWKLLAVLGPIVVIALLYFLLLFAPEALRWMLPEARAKRVLVALLTAATLFEFYGAAGWGAGPVSDHLSLIYMAGGGPVAAVLLVWLVWKRPVGTLEG